MTETIPDHLRETLTHVPVKSWRSTHDIYLRINKPFVTQGAVSNRLADLRALKLVESERRGKAKFWRRAE